MSDRTGLDGPPDPVNGWMDGWMHGAAHRRIQQESDWVMFSDLGSGVDDTPTTISDLLVAGFVGISGRFACWPYHTRASACLLGPGSYTC